MARMLGKRFGSHQWMQIEIIFILLLYSCCIIKASAFNNTDISSNNNNKKDDIRKDDGLLFTAMLGGVYVAIIIFGCLLAKCWINKSQTNTSHTHHHHHRHVSHKEQHRNTGIDRQNRSKIRPSNYRSSQITRTPSGADIVRMRNEKRLQSKKNIQSESPRSTGSLPSSPAASPAASGSSLSIISVGYHARQQRSSTNAELQFAFQTGPGITALQSIADESDSNIMQQINPPAASKLSNKNSDYYYKPQTATKSANSKLSFIADSAFNFQQPVQLSLNNVNSSSIDQKP